MELNNGNYKYALKNPFNDLSKALYNLSLNDLLIILEAYHVNFLNTEITFKNNQFNFKNSKLNSKNTGSVYTQYNIAKEISYKTIINALKKGLSSNIKVLDFGAGTGRFYFSALEILKEQLNVKTDEIIKNNLFAIDIDEAAINILRLQALSKIENLDKGTIDKIFNNIINRNMLMIKELSLFSKNKDNKLDLANDFNQILSNGGFDVIISNPPYSLLKVNKKEVENVNISRFYNELTSKIEDEIKYYKNSGVYNIAIEGMLNYYKLSIEMILKLSNNQAEIGVICPATLFTDQSSKSLRAHLLLKNKLREINYFPESSNLFENVTQSTVIFYANKFGQTENIKIKINSEDFQIKFASIINNFRGH